MTKLTRHPPGPIFISYSRKDMAHFYDIKHTRAGELIWYDARDIKVGEPNWRKSIETAIRACSGVIVICSPNAKDSDPITAEIELAQSYKKPIFPVWVEGEAWALSAPFSLMSYNYVDFRGKKRESVLAVERILEEVWETWSDFFVSSVGTDVFSSISRYYHRVDFEDRHLYVRKKPERRLLEFVQIVYNELMAGRVQPLSYGGQWCLSVAGFYCLPARWAWTPGAPVLDPNFYDQEVERYGITQSSTAVMIPSGLSMETTIGMVVDETIIPQIMMLGINSKRGVIVNLEIFKSVTPEELAVLDLSGRAQFCFENRATVDEYTAISKLGEREKRNKMGPLAWLRRVSAREENADRPVKFAGGVYLSTVTRTRIDPY